MLECLEINAQLTVNKSLVVEKGEEEADELRNFLLRLFSHI
jgi:hypothetical protein